MASTLLRAARRGVCTSADAGPVGVIGLGNMGGHMARNLLRAGRAVVVSDVSPGAMDGLASAGAATAHSPAEVAAKLSDLGGGARTLVTMLPNNDIVRGVYTGADGILSDRAKVEGTLMIDCSTIAPGVAQEVAKAAYANATSSTRPSRAGSSAPRRPASPSWSAPTAPTSSTGRVACSN